MCPAFSRWLARVSSTIRTVVRQGKVEEEKGDKGIVIRGIIGDHVIRDKR